MTATKKVATPADWEVRMTKKVLLNSLIKSLHSFIYSFTSKIVTKNPHFHVVLCVDVQNSILGFHVTSSLSKKKIIDPSVVLVLTDVRPSKNLTLCNV